MRGEGALRCSPFEVTQFPLLPVAFRSLSLSFLSLSLSLDLLIIDWSMDSSWRKREFALLLVDNNGWQQ